MFLKSSATLIVGTAFSLLAITIFEIKKDQQIFLNFIINFNINKFCNIFQDKVCVNKIVLDNHNLQKFDEINPFFRKKNTQKKYLKFIKSRK